jgi:predicted dithiol-disulfide oxidoreductase (DUF899 family)
VKVGTRYEWPAARVALPAEEAELVRRSDDLARERQELPLSRPGRDPEGWPRRHDEYERSR